MKDENGIEYDGIEFEEHRTPCDNLLCRKCHSSVEFAEHELTNAQAFVRSSIERMADILLK